MLLDENLFVDKVFFIDFEMYNNLIMLINKTHYLKLPGSTSASMFIELKMYYPDLLDIIDFAVFMLNPKNMHNSMFLHKLLKVLLRLILDRQRMSVKFAKIYHFEIF